MMNSNSRRKALDVNVCEASVLARRKGSSYGDLLLYANYGGHDKVPTSILVEHLRRMGFSVSVRHRRYTIMAPETVGRKEVVWFVRKQGVSAGRSTSLTIFQNMMS